MGQQAWSVYFRGWEKAGLESRGTPQQPFPGLPAISSPLLSIPLYKAAPNGSSDVHFYLTVYTTIAGLNSLCTLLRAVLFAAGALQAAASLHHRLLHRLLMVRVGGCRLAQLVCVQSIAHIPQSPAVY